MNLGWLMLNFTCSHDHDKDHDHDYNRHGCDLNWLTMLDLKMMAMSKEATICSAALFPAFSDQKPKETQVQGPPPHPRE